MSKPENIARHKPEDPQPVTVDALFAELDEAEALSQQLPKLVGSAEKVTQTSLFFFLTQLEPMIKSANQSQRRTLKTIISLLIRFVEVDVKAPWNTEWADSTMVIGESRISIGGLVTRVMNMMVKPEKYKPEELADVVALLTKYQLQLK